MNTSQSPQISWDSGTAYDLFTSLHVLHHPDSFGLRGSWAAGVRSRLTSPQRTILEDAQELFFSSPLAWVSRLPAPKNANTVIWSLGQIPPTERLPAMAFHADEELEIFAILQEVRAKQSWDESDLEHLRHYHHPKEKSYKPETLTKMLNWWSRAEEFGERYLTALQAYVAVFFAEEERRIKPYLEQALVHAQDLAAQLDFSRLFIELSQGAKVATLEEAEEVMFVPSYWVTPLVMYDTVIEKHWVVLFGARPPEKALVPGETVPDALLRVLKALSEPTRLQILRYLRDKPQTPSQLAKRLRLRAPTVIHHLNILRLAGLVYVTLVEREEKRYTVRQSTITSTFEALRKFLSIE